MDDYYEPEPQGVYETAPQPEPAAQPDKMESLKQLGDLHAQGILTDEEFAAEKAKILNS